MTQPGIEPWFAGPLVNILPTRPINSHEIFLNKIILRLQKDHKNIQEFIKAYAKFPAFSHISNNELYTSIDQNGFDTFYNPRHVLHNYHSRHMLHNCKIN